MIIGIKMASKAQRNDGFKNCILVAKIGFRIENDV